MRAEVLDVFRVSWGLEQGVSKTWRAGVQWSSWWCWCWRNLLVVLFFFFFFWRRTLTAQLQAELPNKGQTGRCNELGLREKHKTNTRLCVSVTHGAKINQQHILQPTLTSSLASSKHFILAGVQGASGAILSWKTPDTYTNKEQCN